MFLSKPARSAANGEEATKKLKEEGLTATYLQADLTDAPSFAAVKEKLVKDHGGLDVLVNNAGMAFKVGKPSCEIVSPRLINEFLCYQVMLSMVKFTTLLSHRLICVYLQSELQMAATDPHAHKVEVTLATNVFGTNMVCDTLFPILKDGARYDYRRELLINSLSFVYNLGSLY